LLALITNKRRGLGTSARSFHLGDARAAFPDNVTDPVVATIRIGRLFKIKMKECLVKTEALLTVEDLASEFNMSSQTPRRRLEDEDIAFRAMKEEVRREVILKWLAEPNIPIGEVSLPPALPNATCWSAPSAPGSESARANIADG
jgi:AraC-like DNA-binding protein